MARMSRWGVAALAGVLALSGCAHNIPNLTTLNREEPFRVGREDVLDVAVWRDPDLSRVVPVRPDGFISLPIVGELQAAGKTPAELEVLIGEKLQPYVQAPKVTVIVREVNSSKVFVTGEVAHPGAFPLRGKVSVVQAIALAGGFSTYANWDGMLVLRNTEKGEQRIPVRYSEFLSTDGQGLYLRPGDTVVVP
jgi:polysaccharide export outer membrane protein